MVIDRIIYIILFYISPKSSTIANSPLFNGPSCRPLTGSVSTREIAELRLVP